mgnify:CR=1 FL=1
MSTKAEIENYLKSEYGMEQDGGVLVGRYETDGGRSQVVMAELTDDNVMFASPFARSSSISAEQVFAKANFPVMMIGDLYVTARIFPLANLQAEEVSFMLAATTLTADYLEQDLGLGDEF